jgi:hypothetical protein
VTINRILLLLLPDPLQLKRVIPFQRKHHATVCSLAHPSG